MRTHLLTDHLATVHLEVFAYSTSVTTGNGKVYYRVSSEIGGNYLIDAGAQVGAAQSTSGTPTIQIARLRAATAGGSRTAVDMLSPVLIIDINEWDSKDAATAVYVDPTYKDVEEGDLLRIDVDVAGTGTQGLFLTLGFG